jgi:hypothetical protein
MTVSAAATVASLFVLRWREGSQRVPIPGYPFVPGLFVLCTLGFAGLATARRPLEPFVGMATIALGIVLYLLSSPMHKAKTRQAHP